MTCSAFILTEASHLTVPVPKVWTTNLDRPEDDSQDGQGFLGSGHAFSPWICGTLQSLNVCCVITQIKYQPNTSEGVCLIRIAPRLKELVGKLRTAWTFCCLDNRPVRKTSYNNHCSHVCIT